MSLLLHLLRVIFALVENAGADRRICRFQMRPLPKLPDTSKGPHWMDRKFDFLVKKRRRLSVTVAGIQETKWFGKDIWSADGYTLLHSGRPLPDENESQVKNEGVGILLDKNPTAAWRSAGESWEAICSQVVMARLKPGCT